MTKQSRPGKKRARIKILVIEDNGEDFVLLTAIVSQIPNQKYDLDFAGDWASAEKMLAKNSYDVVITDYYLASESALDVIAGIKTLGYDVPVVVLTAASSLDSDMQAMEIGAYDYLEKGSVSPEIFDRCVRYVLARVDAEAQIRVAAFYDDLTGLPNRRLLIEKMESAFERSKRRESEVSILLIDLNEFKPINDNYGHEAGDAVLVEVAQRLRDAVRKTDTAARWGGDEFIIVLEDFKDRGNAATVAEKVMSNLEKPIEYKGNIFKVSGSFGMVFYPEFALDVDEIISVADKAMYQAKKINKSTGAAGGTIVVLSPSDLKNSA
ncbi:MAG: GGDEF domain-containing response regulator [Proteobacteria bacterium]|nr:GGDEF domain-containing response regulator [Pseudomonadota bacterium]